MKRCRRSLESFLKKAVGGESACVTWAANAWRCAVAVTQSLPLLLCAAGFLCTATFVQIPPRKPPTTALPEQLGVLVPMRDGVNLAADIFLPGTGGRWPTLLIRTPYNRQASSMLSYHFFRRRGYAVVIQDVRGRHGSQGMFGTTQQEGPDARDTIRWIVQQRWSDGRVVMAGASYVGMASWWAAVERIPNLAAISSMCSGDDEYTDRVYSSGGALQVGHRLTWLAQNLTPAAQVRPLFSSFIEHVPLVSADIAATGTVLPIWRTAIAHPSYDAYWKTLSIREKLKQVTVPVLSFGGWFDVYAQSDLDAFTRLSSQHQTVETWIGPWSHNPGTKFRGVDFGPEADLPIRRRQTEWFDHWLEAGSQGDNIQSGIASLHIFVMGANVWREEHEWPLARMRLTPLYLNSGGRANSVSGDGVLQWSPVRKAPPDQFTYDPKNPVPTHGGAICCDPVLMPPGPLDQSAVETRPDVLVYTSPPLTSDMEVTGPIHVVLYVSTSVNDTDFTAKLVDVQPSGRALLVTDGIQRLRYRLSLDAPTFVKKNDAYQVSIDAGVTSYVFPAGHRIRLEVSSSNFPRFDRNMNSLRPNAYETKFNKARQTVFHAKGYPSEILLPVIPRSDGPSNRNRTQSRATAIAPAKINAPPITLPGVSFSSKKMNPKRITSTTLSLSIGATREAGPSCSARK
jgi:putative CocE/NonD family hydrolase